MQVAVGLGNPGARYAGTRHNLGFRVVDLLAGDLGGRWERAPSYLFAEVVCESRALLLIKPTTYMNGSGVAVAEVLRQFDVGLADVLVVVDDVHLQPGRLRLRRGGSHGGHNGLRSIVETVGCSGFPRLRLGVGMPPEGEDLIGYVLGEFDREELDVAEAAVRTAADGVVCWRTSGLDEAMNRYNAL